MSACVCFAEDSVLTSDRSGPARPEEERAPGSPAGEPLAPSDDLRTLLGAARCVDPVPIGDPDEDEGYDDDEDDYDDDDEEDDEEPMHLAGA